VPDEIQPFYPNETYTLAEYGVVRGSDHAFIPNDERNTDWRVYQLWLNAGNTATPSNPLPPPQQLSFLEFMSLFTENEQAAIIASADVKVKMMIIRAAGATYINMDNPEINVGVNYLASLGLVETSRVATILAGEKP
jgi:hypothetical protein